MSTFTPVSATFGSLSTIVFAPVSAGGDFVRQFRNDVVILVRNNSGGPIDVTVANSADVRPSDGAFPTQAVGELTLQIPDGEIGYIVAIPDSHVLVDGTVSVLCSNDSGVDIAAVRFPK